MFDRKKQSTGATFKLWNRTESAFSDASPRREQYTPIPFWNKVPIRSKRFRIWKKTNVNLVGARERRMIR
jgi:hypothetical protein